MNTPGARRKSHGARGRPATRLVVLFASALALASAASAETWRGLVVAPEHRCATYDRDGHRARGRDLPQASGGRAEFRERWDRFISLKA